MSEWNAGTRLFTGKRELSGIRMSIDCRKEKE